MRAPQAHPERTRDHSTTSSTTRSSTYAWRSIGISNYDAFQVVYRQRFGLDCSPISTIRSSRCDLTGRKTRIFGWHQLCTDHQCIYPDQLYSPSDYVTICRNLTAFDFELPGESGSGNILRPIAISKRMLAWDDVPCERANVSEGWRRDVQREQ